VYLTDTFNHCTQELRSLCSVCWRRYGPTVYYMYQRGGHFAQQQLQTVMKARAQYST